MTGYYRDDIMAKQRREFILRTLSSGLKNMIASRTLQILMAVICIAEVVIGIVTKNALDNSEGFDRLQWLGKFASLVSISIFADVVAIFFAGRPLQKKRFNRAFVSAGLVDKAGTPPQLLREEPYHDKDFGESTKQTFLSPGVPYSAWVDNLEALESALNRKILYVNVGEAVDMIEIITTSPNAYLPTEIEWSDEHLPSSDADYVLGKALPDRDLKYNTDDEPNVLIAATTGGGKTNLIRSQIHQALARNVKVLLIDKKRGVDFGKNITRKVTVLKEDDEIALELQGVVDEMNRRFDEIAACEGANNIREYRALEHTMQRILIVVDELAQLTQRKSASAADKKVTDSIILSLSRIAQLGRAVGITMVLSTQRPSEDVLPRQVASNINVKICGKADENLSRVVFGDSRADKMVPKNIKGRFMLEDGTMFQAYFCKYLRELRSCTPK